MPYFYRNADNANLLDVVTKFDQLASRSPDPTWQRKAQSYLGIVYADAGDIYRALTSYAKALRTARQMKDFHGEALVLLNMGTALMTAGLYADSLRAFASAFEIGMSNPSYAAYACASATNMAQVCCFEGRYSAGIEYLETALGLDANFPDEQYDLHRVVLEQIYVQLATFSAKPELALRRLRLCEEFSQHAQSTRAAMIASLARGLYEAEFGNVSTGESILASLSHRLTARSSEWIDSRLFLIRALEKLGKVEEALQCAESLTQGLAQLSEFGARALTEVGDRASALLHATGLEKAYLQRSQLATKVAHQQAARARWEAVERLAMAAELKSDPTGFHGYRVGKLSAFFAGHLGLDPSVVARIEVAGRLHDIGKIALPDQVLMHSGKVSHAERQVLNAHARIGADLLGRSEIPDVQCAEIVARYHHERWDGHGYPSGLAGKRIPLECRIVAIADCFDAMIHGRPGMRGVSVNVALTEIQLQADKQFDPDLAFAFEGFARQLAAAHPSIEAYLAVGAKPSPLAKALCELNELLAEVTDCTTVPAWTAMRG